jgi:hypothetical protein
MPKVGYKNFKMQNVENNYYNNFTLHHYNAVLPLNEPEVRYQDLTSPITKGSMLHIEGR